MPDLIQRSKKILSMELVAHITMSAAPIASSGEPTGSTSIFKATLMSPATATQRSRLGAKHRMVSILRPAHAAISCVAACQPEPRMPTVLSSLRARYLMPRPLVAPTRMRCRTPSGRIANGSPLSEENNRTKPTYRPFGAAGTLTRRLLVPCFGQVTMSESMRTAPTPNFGITPSIDFRLYSASFRSDGTRQSERTRLTPRPSLNSTYASSSTSMHSGIVNSLSTSSLDRMRVMRSRPPSSVEPILEPDPKHCGDVDPCPNHCRQRCRPVDTLG